MQYGLEHYIVKLLTQHDCAIVPNLGGFVVQHESAQLLSDRIVPPHATVGFNPLLTHTDGHLAALVMRTEGIDSYREASAMIDEQVSVWQHRLSQHEVLSLGVLGSLSKSQEGQTIYTPGNLDFLPANFGLVPLYRKQPLVEPRPVLSLQRSYLRYAAACAVLLLACLTPRHEGDRYIDSATLDPTIWTRPVVQVAEVVPQPVAADTLVLAPEVAMPADLQAVSVERSVVFKHHLVVASIDKTSADDYCMELQSQGHEQAHVLPYKNGLYRVVIQSYATRRDALDAMTMLRASERRFAKAWVFCE